MHEIRTLQLFVDMLRRRVGSPVSLAGLAQALHISPTTAGRYLEILEALYVVFRVTPWHRDVARSIVKQPKVYFFDTGLVEGDAGARLENAVAAMLLKHVHFRQDAEGRPVSLHTIRDKEQHEIDFVLADGDTLTDLIEVKLADSAPAAYFHRTAQAFSQARAIQIVAELRGSPARPHPRDPGDRLARQPVGLNAGAASVRTRVSTRHPRVCRDSPGRHPRRPAITPPRASLSQSALRAAAEPVVS
ncbi:MAG: DUF4143 domain-containing protein [Betaproteobacteria bacterium]|nr:DUF4143 domain-containing protein [Betaproteobacteria bacterium]